MPYLFGPSVEEKKAEALQNCVIHLDESVKEIERALSGMRQSLNDQRDDMKQILQESAFSRVSCWWTLFYDSCLNETRITVQSCFL